MENEQQDWVMMAIIAVLTAVASLLKAVSAGAPWEPRNVLMRLLAKALYTGIVAAGVWSAISEFRELAPATAVAISAGVTILGADVVESIVAAYIKKKFGGDDDSGGPTPPPAVQSPAFAPNPEPEVKDGTVRELE